MNSIIILDENTSNQIAAGEVIEGPSSVIKELLENSIDAGADSINIEISKGGISLIKINDNGTGIPSEDAEMAFERHGTSKIRSADDLIGITTMGFRGEALPSIASVSKVELNTRTELTEYGVCLNISNGNLLGKRKSTREKGTTISVKDLFFNVPARYKFLKSDSTETRYCTDIVSRLALAHPDISFRYFSNGAELLRTPGDGKLKNVIFCIYGRELSTNLYKVDYNDGNYEISGFIGNRTISRGNRQNQTIFVNGRYIKSREITAAVEKAYETEIMKGKFPFFILNLKVNPGVVDVNVHPAKSEVRFAKGNEVFSAVFRAVRSTLDKDRGISSSASSKVVIKRENDYTKTQTSIPAVSDYKVGYTAPKQLHESMKQTKDLFHSTMKKQEEKTEKKEQTINILEGSSYAGVLFNTFILMQKNKDELIVIDQHAAHERITYENLLEQYIKRKIDSQILLLPVRVQLSAAEVLYIEENKELLEKLGFDFDFLGRSEIALRSIPSELTSGNAEVVFKGALDGIENNRGKDAMTMEKEVLYSMACRNAIKANTVLTELEIKVLAERLMSMDNPYTCPHGRPVILKLTRRELEKLFKRII